MKRLLKALLLLSIAALILVGVFGITVAAISPNRKGKGLSFTNFVYKKQYPNETYQTEKNLEEVPHSFEAWVYLPVTIGNSNAGTIIGNFSAKSGGRFSFEIAENRHPSLRFSNRSTSVKHTAVFDDIELKITQWLHIVIVWDDSLGELRCYVNGELGQTIKAETLCGDECADGCVGFFDLYSAEQYNLCLGGDLSYLCENFFKGALQDVAMYSDVLTESEIKNSYKNGVNVDNEELIVYYDIDESDKKCDIEDLSGNGYHMYFSKTWLTEKEMEKVREEKGFADEYAYSIAVIADPQYSTRLTPANVEKMYQWVVDNKEAKNIQYVVGLGDITDNCTAAEWERALEAFKIFERGNLEFSFVRGNHDVGNGVAQNAVIAPEKYDELMGAFEFYTNQFDNYGGYYKEGSVVNTYRTLTMGGDDWLLLNLDWNPGNDVLAWACSIVEAHPNHRVMIATHENVAASGFTSSNGTKLWNNLTSKYENIELVLSGHISWDNIMVYQTAGVHGNTVTQILIDPQRLDLILGGRGIVAMFYFREDGNLIDIEYYSTVEGKYYKNRNQMTVDLDADGRQFVKKWNGTTAIAPQGSGTQSDPYRIYDGSNLLWMAEQLTAYGADGNAVAPTEIINVFKDKYFVQMQTINLHGHTLPTIGNYFESDSVCSVFAGHYDGQGYAIYNGKIENPLGSVSGLFGAIRGATIENLVLRDISVNASADAGILVGIATAPEGSLSFNKINGCHVESSCTLTVSANGSSEKVYAIGSVIGNASGAEVADCRSDATIEVKGIDSVVGGIVGNAKGENLIVDSVSNVTVNLADAARYACGGILGSISESSSTTVASCVSNCNISFVGTQANGLYLGGILGSCENLSSGSANALINCKSSGEIKVTGTKDSVYVAGIVGYALRNDQSEPLFVSGCKNGTDYSEFNTPGGANAVVSGKLTFARKDTDAHTVSCDCGCGESATLYHVYNEHGQCRFCGAAVTGARVIIGKEFSIEFFAKIYDSALSEGKSVVMQFSMGGETVTAEGIFENGEYVFKLDGITPEQIGDTIDATLLIVNGEEKTPIASKLGYSIKKYCLSVLAQNPENKELSDLVGDILACGAAAQSYKKHNTHSFVTAGTNIPATERIVQNEAAESLEGNKNDSFRIGNISVSADNGVALKVDLSIADLSLAEIKVNGKKFDLKTLESLGDGRHYTMSVSDIFVADYTAQNVIKLYYNGELCSKLTFCMSSYIAEEISNTQIANAELSDYLLASYRFAYSAKAYIDSIS